MLRIITNSTAMSSDASRNGLRHVIGLVSERDTVQLDWEPPEDFDPNLLLDGLIAKMRLESDAALAHKLQVIQPIIRMIREGTLSMTTSTLLLWIQEATGIKLDELRELLKTEQTGR
jgi:hypothetical protein